MGTNDGSVPDGWTEQKRPLTWNKRFDFADYAQTRAFLDCLATVSEGSGYYPNLSFARTHAVVTIQFEGEEVDARLREFAGNADLCAQRLRN